MVMATNQPYEEFRVNSLPNSGFSRGDRYYLNVGGGKYQTYIVSDSLQLTKEAGVEFIECGTMQEMRSLSPRQIWALENEHYKGVKLNGYYAKGDTPAPIEYYLSDTTEGDDGGSVFLVGDIKLEHDFGGVVDVRYFGCLDGEDCTLKIQNCINAVKEGSTVVINGDYFSTSDYGWFNQGIKLRSNIDLEINGSVTLLPSYHGQYNIFSAYNVSNFNIYGKGTIIGDKFRHLNSQLDTAYYKRRSNNTTYSAGDYVYIAIYGLKVTTSGTTGTSQPPISGTTVGATITDGSVVYEVVSINLGEQGYGVSFYECSNFSMNGVTIKECWGDGYIFSGTRYTDQENIGCRDFSISFVKSENNRRQGLSVMGARNGSLYSCFFNNTYGTTPQAGIDFEPNNREIVRSISIDSCYFNDNEGAGIQIYNKHPLAILEDVTITSCFFRNNRNALYFREPNVNSININSLFCSSSVQQAVVFIDGAQNVTIKDITIRNSPQAFQFNGASNVRIENMDVEGATVTAVGMSGNGLTRGRFKGGTIKGSSQYGILSSRCNDITIEDLLIEGSGSDGIRFSGGTNTDVKFNNIRVYNSQNYGMYLENIEDFSIRGSKLKDSGLSIDNSFSHIRCGVATNIGIIENNSFRTSSGIPNVARYCINIAVEANLVQVGLNDYRSGFKNGDVSSASTTSDISKYSPTSTIKGMVAQSTAVQNVGASNLTAATSPDASDLASVILLTNDLKNRWNSQNLALVNELRQKVNSKLTVDRTSGQQAT